MLNDLLYTGKLGFSNGMDVKVVKHDELVYDSVTGKSFRLRDDGENTVVAGHKIYMTEKIYERLQEELQKSR